MFMIIISPPRAVPILYSVYTHQDEPFLKYNKSSLQGGGHSAALLYPSLIVSANRRSERSDAMKL